MELSEGFELEGCVSALSGSSKPLPPFCCIVLLGEDYRGHRNDRAQFVPHSQWVLWSAQLGCEECPTVEEPSADTRTGRLGHFWSEECPVKASLLDDLQGV